MKSNRKELQEMDLNISNYMLISSVVFAVIHFLWRTMSIISFATNRDKLYAEKYILDDKLTKKIREITKNDKLMVRIDDTIEGKKELNAFTPGANTIVCNQFLIDYLEDDEIIAVVLHEYGHIAEKHTNQFFKYDTGYTFLLHSLVITAGLFGLPFLMLFIWGVEHILGLRDIAHFMYQLATSKSHEYAADSYAAKFGYAKSLISAFKKFEKREREMICKNLEKKKCDRLISKVHRWSTHPTHPQRIKKLTKLIATKYAHIKQRFSIVDVNNVEKMLNKFGKKDNMEKIIGDTE